MLADEVLPVIIRARAAAEPERVFLQDVDGGSMTIGELHAQAMRWASALRERGVSAEDPVAVMMPNSFATIAIWLGLSWLRAWEVPLNAAYRGSMLGRLTTHSGAKVIVTHERYAERFEDIREELPEVRELIVVGESDAIRERASWIVHSAEELTAAAESELELQPPQPWDIATILHTSGTTGMSKGVLNPWAQVHATAFGNIPRDVLGPDDVWYSPLPLFHIGGKLVVCAMAVIGGRIVLRERFSTTAFWGDIRRWGATATILIGTTAAYIGNLPPREDDADNPLRYVQMAPLPAHPEEWKTRFGVQITSSYNMTEISSAIWTEGETPNARTCGRVRDGYHCRIVDEHDQELPDGTPGELVVRADQPWVLMAGYHRRPEATAAAWRNLWFHTGDLAVRDEDGWFYYLDRLTDSIRRRGENISSIEIEVEVNSFPGIAESAAVGVPSELGEDEVKVAVVIEDGAAFAPRDLIDFLTPRLADFMLPRYIAVVDALPRTPTEKIRKREIRAADIRLAWDRLGDQPL